MPCACAGCSSEPGRRWPPCAFTLRPSRNRCIVAMHGCVARVPIRSDPLSERDTYHSSACGVKRQDASLCMTHRRSHSTRSAMRPVCQRDRRVLSTSIDRCLRDMRLRTHYLQSHYLRAHCPQAQHVQAACLQASFALPPHSQVPARRCRITCTAALRDGACGMIAAASITRCPGWCVAISDPSASGSPVRAC
jgi:hypothetical protein